MRCSVDAATSYDRSSALARASVAAPARGPQIVIHAASGLWPTAGALSMVGRRCVALPPPGFAMAATAHCYRRTSPNATTACIPRTARGCECGTGTRSCEGGSGEGEPVRRVGTAGARRKVQHNGMGTARSTDVLLPQCPAQWPCYEGLPGDRPPGRVLCCGGR